MLFYTGNKGKFQEFKEVLPDLEQPTEFISVHEIDQFEGKMANWRVMLAKCDGNTVKVYRSFKFWI